MLTEEPSFLEHKTNQTKGTSFVFSAPKTVFSTSLCILWPQQAPLLFDSWLSYSLQCPLSSKLHCLKGPMKIYFSQIKSGETRLLKVLKLRDTCEKFQKDLIRLNDLAIKWQMKFSVNIFKVKDVGRSSSVFIYKIMNSTLTNT